MSDPQHMSAMDLLRRGNAPPPPPAPPPPAAPAPPQPTPPAVRQQIATAPAPVSAPQRGAGSDEEIRKQILTNNIVDREIVAISKSVRRFVVFVGFGGAIAGICGLVFAASLFPLKTKEIQYLLVHDTSGEITKAVSVKDAPLVFPEVARIAALRGYIEWREGYLPESRDIGQVRTRLMSSGDERARYFKDYAEKLPDGQINRASPLIRYGNAGGARASEFMFGLPQVITTSNPPTYIYVVRFTKAETIAGVAEPPRRWIATIQCQFRPDLMDTQDKLTTNPAGLQVLAYKSEQEPEVAK